MHSISLQNPLMSPAVAALTAAAAFLILLQRKRSYETPSLQVVMLTSLIDFRLILTIFISPEMVASKNE